MPRGASGARERATPREYERDALGGESAPGAEAKREGTDGGE